MVSGAQVEGGIGEVSQDGTGGGILTGSATVEQGVAYGVAADGHGIERVVHRGEHMGVGD